MPRPASGAARIAPDSPHFDNPFDMTTSSAAAATGHLDVPLWKELAPLCLMVFLEFLAMGLPLPVLPVHVHDTLGFGSLVVGLAIGIQSIATLLTRHAAGTRADRDGPRRAALLGLVLSGVAGAIYALSASIAHPTASLAVLLAGRALLGLGESFVITGALAWGVAIAGRQRSGVVMAWIGIAMYGALAAGAPLGFAIDRVSGFVGLSMAAALAPIVGIAGALGTRPVAATGGTRLPFLRVVRLIMLPGAGLALSAVGFGAIAGFSGLAFAARGWAHAELAMTAFGAAYVLARLLFGRLPDRFGGARVAVAAVATAALGQRGLGLATSGTMAIVAAALTGFGYSLAFPSFGVAAIGQVPPQSRGAALGAYTACFDAAMGFGVPVLGLLVGASGYGAAFAAGTVAAIGSLLVAITLATRAGEA
jgi:MFS family permease